MNKLYLTAAASLLMLGTAQAYTIDDIVGTFSCQCSGQDYWNYEWASFSYGQTITIEKTGENTISMDGLYWAGSYPLKGEFDEFTQSIIFEAQMWGAYGFCAFDWDDASDSFRQGGSVVASINEDGTISIENFTATYDWGEGYGLYYYLWGTKAELKKTITMEELCGTYDAVTTGQDYWNYEWAAYSYDQTMTISQVDSCTVTINGLYWTDDLPLTGKVDFDSMTITLPAQAWGSYTFEGFHYDYTNNCFVQGDSVVAKIGYTGSIEIANYTATYDWGAEYGLYYYLWDTKSVLTKQALPALNIADLVGTYSAVCAGQDYFSYEDWADFSYEQTLTVSQVNDSTIQIEGLYWDAEATKNTIVGIVNPELRSIRFDDQEVTDGYRFCAYDWNFDDNYFQPGGSVTAKVATDGSISMSNFTPYYDFGGEDGIWYYLWSATLNMTKSENTAITTVQKDAATTGNCIYNLAGTRVRNDREHLAKGLYIINGKKCLVK